MQIQPFKIERFFARYEFSVEHLLSASDCESLSLQQVLNLSDAEGLHLWDNLSLGYTETQGHPLLRGEIAGLYQCISPADLLVAAPEEAIFLTMTSLLRPNDHLIVTFPGYQSSYQIAQDTGCRVSCWSLQPAGGRWVLDLDGLRQSITEQTKMLAINFPHNPPGYIPSRADWEAILDIARQADLILFSDEMYWHLEHRPEAHLPAVCDHYEKGVSLFGMSKTLSLPGLRIGWLATRDTELLAKLMVQKDYTTICSSAPSEVLALIALRARKEIIGRNQAVVQQNLQLARSFFGERQDWFEWLEPQGGSIAFPRFLGPGTVADFCQRLVEAESAMILPGAVFEMPHHFRLGLGRKGFPAALDKLGDFI